jgi:hypothetical protein
LPRNSDRCDPLCVSRDEDSKPPAIRAAWEEDRQDARSPSRFARWATTGGSAKPNAKDSTKSIL